MSKEEYYRSKLDKLERINSLLRKYISRSEEIRQTRENIFEHIKTSQEKIATSEQNFVSEKRKLIEHLDYQDRDLEKEILQLKRDRNLKNGTDPNPFKIVFLVVTFLTCLAGAFYLGGEFKLQSLQDEGRLIEMPDITEEEIPE